LNSSVEKQSSGDRTNTIIGIATGLFALVLYLKTVAPTISFWDCGEFVAASICFGIPHPPGSAVFVLFGRIFAVIPFGDDLAYRVNLISAFSSAGSVLVAYFITTRIVGLWQQPGGDLWQKIGMYIAGVIGALCMGFNRTFWTNAVEAEVYGLTMLVFFVIIYLLIDWQSRHEEPEADKTLILIYYLALIGVGIHMTAFIVMPAGIIFMAIVDKRLRTDPRFWITSALTSLVMTDIKWFLFGSLAWLLLSGVLWLRSNRDRNWGLSAAMSLAVLLGFSVQFYVPVRSHFDPPLDMNNADNFGRFISFLEREQYGQKNMFIRMLNRRADLSNQFGDFPRMGMMRFFKEQYSSPGVPFYLLFLLGLYGLYTAAKKHGSSGMLVGLLVLAGTIGLTLYMNFADGTQVDPGTQLERLEVRDRDYFWTPGFAMFGLCLGLGFAALYFGARGMMMRKKLSGSVIRIASAAMALLVLLPVVTLAHNYRACDRTYDRVPYDFAYNVLNSCEPDCVLFTAGDNDTFPLWALQFGLGIRRDVHVVNLSLLDTDWYALQMKKDLESLGGLISLDTNQIQTVPTDVRGMTLNIPEEPYDDPVRKKRHLLIPFQDENGKTIKVSDQIIENIIINNNWKHPIYFANMPSDEVAFNLPEQCERVGFVFKITREKRNGAMNLNDSYRLMTETMQFRSLDNPLYYRDETKTEMAISAGQKHTTLFNELLMAQDSARARDVFEQLGKKIPEFWEIPMNQFRVDSLFGIAGKSDLEYKEEYLKLIDRLLEHNPDNYYYLQYKGIVSQAMGRLTEAVAALKRAFDIMPASSLSYRSLMSAYIASGNYQDAMAVSRYYLHLNPYDDAARRLVEAYGASSAKP
jgi:hypothetical protein